MSLPLPPACLASPAGAHFLSSAAQDSKSLAWKTGPAPLPLFSCWRMNAWERKAGRCHLLLPEPTLACRQSPRGHSTQLTPKETQEMMGQKNDWEERLQA